jgi:exodeoxyribonuclease-1
LPIKTLRFNVCPALAPLGVLDEASQKRLQLDLTVIRANLKKLQAKDFIAKVLLALEIMDKQQQTRLLEDEQDVDSRLYDGFLNDADRIKMSVVRAAEPSELLTLAPDFDDARLSALLPLYVARNYPMVLDAENRQLWEHFRERKLVSGGQLNAYQKRLSELNARKGITSDQRYVLEELRLYGESIMPGEPGE